MLFFPNDVIVKVTIDDLRIRKNLNIRSKSPIPKKPSIKTTNKSFFYTLLGFIKTLYNGFIQKEAGTRKTEKKTLTSQELIEFI